MNQEKIGKLIKEIRKKEGLSQEKFAEKYGVTYQAVSKWENGKNIPDITILKQICTEYQMNLDDLFDGTKTKKKRKKNYLIIIIIFLLIITVGSTVYLTSNANRNNDDFHFKKLSTTCENFNIYGSIAYNENKTSLYISNISYCGESDKNEYKEIECTLYETEENTKTKISTYNYQEKHTISLEEFLKDVHFSVEHYSKSCRLYQENSLYLEIKAIQVNNQITLYDIPLNLEENCME